MTLQSSEDDDMEFDLASNTLEELFKWYQVAWDITQRAMSRKMDEEREVSVSASSAAALSLSLPSVSDHVSARRLKQTAELPVIMG